MLVSDTISVFFFNDTATTEIYTLSLHDALPILPREYHTELLGGYAQQQATERQLYGFAVAALIGTFLLLQARSEEHTSELQSRQYLVCRLLLEKKKKNTFILAAVSKKTTLNICQ